ncbi:MAG: PQQ-dependent sugar dehydrogenase [Candidatus Yanofskybacteria bacterium]|nr:PQQ-dependent sugar dehydrogenase [Candidatus Yanofskybacteria bacterium]
MKRIALITAGVVAIWAVNFYWSNLRGVWPGFLPDTNELVEQLPSDEFGPIESNATDFPLSLKDGFSISILAKDIEGARVMAFDSSGNLWVSQTSQNAITQLEIKNGKVVSQKQVYRNLRRPHGLAFDPDNPSLLYIAEEHRISRVTINSNDTLHQIADLPAGGGHFTRTLGFGPDRRLYVSIGSSCNVCLEEDSRRAKIFSMRKDGSNFQEVARGLRNSVFFTWHPVTRAMWATEMGRDLLGDNIPPDEINIIQGGKNYGWPICYGKNIHDDSFDKNTYIRNPCMEPFEMASHIDIQAHSAPLGLAFMTGQNFPNAYQNNLLVAYHGSWNRSEPTGYKIVRYRFDQENIGGFSVEDFISGWLTSKNKVLGRPVDIVVRQGAIYISDDAAGLIYKVNYRNPASAATKTPLPTPSTQVVADGCRVTGCSGQICSDREVITTCEYKDEYACYQNATCERQSNGQCGWTVTNWLNACLIQ